MEKKNVVIYVAGQRFSISTADSEEYVMGIGEKVDVMIKGIAKDNPRLNRDACAILAALSLCDDESKLRQMMEVLRSQVKDYLEATEKLREENLSLKAQIKELTSGKPQTDSPCKEEPVVTEIPPKAEETPAEEDKVEDTEDTPVAPVASPLSRSESLVMAQASETPARQTAFVGKDFRSGKKGKKNKKHHNHNTSAAPATPVAPAVANSADTEEEEASPYHQFSIFDGLE